MSAEPQGTAAKRLNRNKYMNLVTYRTTGAEVVTPVWFAEHDGTLYIDTGAASGKVKRIRRTPRVTVALCTASGKETGPRAQAMAYIVNDPAEERLAEAALARKYGLQRRLLYGGMEAIRRLRRRPEEASVYVAVTFC